MKHVIRSLCALLTLAGMLQGQSPPLQNTGVAPLRLPFLCTPETLAETGLSCPERSPCPVFLELTGAETFLDKIFLAGNLHTADVTLFSVLLATSDNGKTWSEPHPRLPFTSLEQIQFVDFQNGWVSGANLQGVPRDPFFLVSSDGGASWRLRPIFPESRAGVVESFWFESKSNGVLWIDTKLRHEFYETRTSGDDWALRQSSRLPLPSARARVAASPLIRLRPDSRTKAYHVEKQLAGKWLPVAAFLIDAGVCKE